MHLLFYLERMEYPIARRKAIRLLSMRSMHSKVLCRKLKEQGCAEAICKQVLEEMQRLHFLNDEESMLASFRRGYGPKYIAYKFRIEMEEVERVISKEMQ